MRSLFVGVIVLGIVSTVSAQEGVPRFEDYAVRETYTGPSHAPVLATSEQRTFRTRLQEASTEKPNFAGHYILTTWGCGTGCVIGGVIDAKTGEVTMMPFTVCCWGVDVPDDFEPVVFRLDSRLVIFDGARDENESDKGKHYYMFENGGFKMLKTIK